MLSAFHALEDVDRDLIHVCGGFYDTITGILFSRLVEYKDQRQKQQQDGNSNKPENPYLKAWQDLEFAIGQTFYHYNSKVCYPTEQWGYFFKDLLS